MKVKMFCQARAAQSNMPGNSTQVLRLVSIPDFPTKDGKGVTKSPNADLFDGNGSIALECSNVTKATAESFEPGRSYIVEVREAGPNE